MGSSVVCPILVGLMAETVVLFVSSSVICCSRQGESVFAFGDGGLWPDVRRFRHRMSSSLFILFARDGPIAFAPRLPDWVITQPPNRRRLNETNVSLRGNSERTTR